MTIERAIKLVTIEYERAKKLNFIRNPLAYALYKVWKRADSETKADTCVCCGEIIPEGRQVCHRCERRAEDGK